MTNTAIVEKIENDYVIVSSLRRGSCGDNCAMCGNCSAEKVYTKAFCDIYVDVGDAVIVESNTRCVLFAMCLVFILPLILPILLYFIFMRFGVILSVLSVLIGFVISCLIICFLSHSDAYIKKITPKIVAIDNKK